MKYPPEGLLYDTAENQDAIAGRRGLELACMEGRTLEARAVRCDGNCNLYVELNGRLAVIPRGEAILDPARQKDVAVLSRVGRPVCFKVLCAPGGSEEEPRLLLSRRAAQEEAMEYFMTKLTPGEVIWCTVTRLESFGAFVDIRLVKFSVLKYSSSPQAYGIGNFECVQAFSVVSVVAPLAA